MFDLKTHQHSLTVYIEDTDQYGVVYHANYLKFFERGRTEWLRQQGVCLSDLTSKGLSLVVTHINIDYKNKTQLDTVLTVNTRLSKWRFAIGHFEQVIRDKKSDQLICRATVHIACLNDKNALHTLSDIIDRS